MGDYVDVTMSNRRERESVWDYPRPPRVEPLRRHVRVEVGGATVADSSGAVRILETASPPTIYLPPDDVRLGQLRPARGETYCEWKGTASYLDVISGQTVRNRAAWTYRDPKAGFQVIRDWIAFYPGRVDAAWLDDEPVTPQPGGFYGGWITAELDGPFKGGPGSEGW